MLYSVKNIEDLEHLQELVSIKCQVEEVRLQDRLGKQKFHGKTETVFQPVTHTKKYIIKINKNLE